MDGNIVWICKRAWQMWTASSEDEKENITMRYMRLHSHCSDGWIIFTAGLAEHRFGAVSSAITQPARKAILYYYYRILIKSWCTQQKRGSVNPARWQGRKKTHSTCDGTTTQVVLSNTYPAATTRDEGEASSHCIDPATLFCAAGAISLDLFRVISVMRDVCLYFSLSLSLIDPSFGQSCHVRVRAVRLVHMASYCHGRNYITSIWGLI